MVNPASGPFLFETSAESWLGRTEQSEALDWIREYLSHHEIHISAITVMERVRGYSLLWRRAEEGKRERIEAARVAYLTNLGRVVPLDELTDGAKDERVFGRRQRDRADAVDVVHASASSRVGCALLPPCAAKFS